MGVFKVRWQETTGGAYTTLTLFPVPTAVEYPQRRDYNTRVGPDGNVVVQRPMRDARPRKWIWSRYRDTVPGYSSMWPQLELLEYRLRQQAGKPATVEIWEDVTKTGGFDRGTFASPTWTKVRFMRVDRTMAPGSGSVYEESVIEFVIDDTTYSGF